MLDIDLVTVDIDANGELAQHYKVSLHSRSMLGQLTAFVSILGHSSPDRNRIPRRGGKGQIYRSATRASCAQVCARLVDVEASCWQR